MSKLKNYALIVFLSIVLSACVSRAEMVFNTQICKGTSDRHGLSVCSIAMEQKLSELIDEEKTNQCKCSFHKRFTIFEENARELNIIAKENHVFAIMSANAYDKGFQVEIPGWTRVQRLISNKGLSADIYKSNTENHLVIAYRGTDDTKDWVHANIDINSDINGQYNNAVHVYDKVKATYSNPRITTVGHSLGGGLAIHVSVIHEDVDAIVFNPSPRLFIPKGATRFHNKVIIIYETGEILTAIRSLFTTLDKVKHSKYKFNYLGGNAVTEHSMPKFAQCMYVSTLENQSIYSQWCRGNTL